MDFVAILKAFFPNGRPAIDVGASKNDVLAFDGQLVYRESWTNVPFPEKEWAFRFFLERDPFEIEYSFYVKEGKLARWRCWFENEDQVINESFFGACQTYFVDLFPEMSHYKRDVRKGCGDGMYLRVEDLPYISVLRTGWGEPRVLDFEKMNQKIAEHGHEYVAEFGHRASWVLPPHRLTGRVVVSTDWY